MFKKIISPLLLIMMLLSQTSMAAITSEPLQPELVTDYVSEVKASPDTFEPGAGKYANLSFDVINATVLDFYVLDTRTDKAQTVFVGHSTLQTGSYSYKWYGTVNNQSNGAALQEGDYLAVAIAYDSKGDISDTEYDYITIKKGSTTPTLKVPSITDLSVSPRTFNPDSQSTNIQFTTNEVSYVTVVVKDGSNVIREFAGYDDGNDEKAAGTYTISWNGRDDGGDKVADGTYTVSVAAKNSSGRDLETANVTVKKGSTPPSDNAPHISSLTVVPKTFNPDEESANIKFTTDSKADLTVEIKDGSEVIREFSSYDGDQHIAGTYTIAWNGKDDDGDKVDEGTYTVAVTAKNDNGSDSETTTTTVEYDSNPTDDGIIKDVELDPEDDWNPIDEDLEITFRLTDDSDILTVVAREVSTGDIVEIYDEDDVDSGKFEIDFDGTDDDNDYIDSGEWEIIVRADGSKVVAPITVEYDNPEITEAFVTKDEFDIDQDEFTTLVFKVDEDAIVTVEVYKGTKRQATLMDEEDVDKNDWNTIKFDGYDEDDDDLSNGKYTFKITAEGEGEGDEDIQEVDFEIDEDDVSSDKPNATNDYTDPVVFDEDKDSKIEINFCIDEDADVDLTIHKGKSASGKSEAELLDDVAFSDGCHTITWDGTDEDGKDLKDDIYSWKLVAKDGSKKDTEIGRFVIGDLNGKNGGTNPKPPVHGNGNCGGYWDTQNVGYELCDALDWLKGRGIMTGNPDGSFRPYDAINRAEVLKITLETFQDEVTFLPANGSDFGFHDVNPNAWYATYVRTGKFYGMLHGYLNATEARLSNTINRVELLKFVLEATDAFSEWEKPGFESSYFSDVDARNPLNDWYFDYAGVSHQYGLFDGGSNLYPGAYANRGEAALVLYRMYKAGLIK